MTSFKGPSEGTCTSGEILSRAWELQVPPKINDGDVFDDAMR
jgi:hypothetical protein